MDLRSQALAELAAAEEKPYLDDDADREAATGFYGDVDPEQDGALAQLVEHTHRDRLRYSPAKELYPWVDLQPDRMVRSIYTQEEFDPKELIEEAARIHERREALRVTAASEAAVEELEPYNCEHVVCQSWFDHAEPMRGDLHHLFACERKCNSFRGNAPYTDFPDYLEVVRESCGKKETATFEPAAGKGGGGAGNLLLPAPLSRGAALRRRGDRGAAPVARGRAGVGVRASPQRRDLRASGQPEPVDRPRGLGSAACVQCMS